MNRHVYAADNRNGEHKYPISEAAKSFYQECADREGITLTEWLEKAEKGEF